MPKQKVMTASSLLSEILHVGVYKPSQGRITRQATCGALAVAFIIAAYRAYVSLAGVRVWEWALPLLLLLAGLWGSYRLVNYARFADFLIAVEAEMYKVSWPSRAELMRSSIVVILVIFVLAMVLFVYDSFWTVIFRDVLKILE